MKKQIVLLMIFAGLAMASHAQNYDHALGLRGGPFSGITYKQHLSSGNYLEGVASFRWRGFLVTGLYEMSAVIDEATPGLTWYYGFGAHVGFWSGYYDNAWFDEDGDSYTAIGVDGIIGIEYTFEDVPINISADWKPAINLIGTSSALGIGSGAASIRYTF